MKPKEFTEALEAELTDEEVAEYSKKLSGSVIEYEKLKGEAKRVARHYASRLDLLAKEQQDYAVKVEERKEIRQVECEERPQYDLGVIWIVRLDTFDKVRERPMTAQDRQARIFEDETGGLRNEFLEDRDAAVEEEQQQAEPADEERERLHKEAVANWRRERPSSDDEPAVYVCQQCGDEVETDLSSTDNLCSRCWTPDAIKDPDERAAFLAENTDDFTAPRCDECGRIDGAHTKECSKSDALRFDDYLAYAQAHFKRNWSSHARKMELTRLKDDEVRAWKNASARQQQASNGVEAEPTKSKKLSPVEAAIDR